MKIKKRIAFIGFGSIGQDVIAGLKPFLTAQQLEVFVLARRPAECQIELDHLLVSSSFSDLLSFKPDLVVEVASQQAVQQFIPDCLKLGSAVLITSIGALADEGLYQELSELAQKHHARIILPSGAIAGLDYLDAVKEASDLEVVYESREPVDAWIKELEELGLEPNQLKEPVTLFQGKAQEAALRYPKNLNVAATLALAGVGMEKTKVAVIADPGLSQNKHVIKVHSQFGSVSIEVSNVPSPTNPKSSWVVAQSIISAIKKQFAAITLA